MAFDIDTADLRRMTGHWIEWGTNNMDAVRSLLKGQAAVIPLVKDDFVEIKPADEMPDTHIAVLIPDGSSVCGFCIRRLDTANTPQPEQDAEGQ